MGECNVWFVTADGGESWTSTNLTGVSASNYNGTGINITAKNYRTVVTASVPSDTGQDKYITTWKKGKYYRKESSNNGYLKEMLLQIVLTASLSLLLVDL